VNAVTAVSEKLFLSIRQPHYLHCSDLTKYCSKISVKST